MCQSGILEILLLTTMAAASTDVLTNESLWTVREHTNVRARPSTKAEIITVLAPGMLVRVGSEENGWSAVSHHVDQSRGNGDKVGYVRTQLLVIPNAAYLSDTRAGLTDRTTSRPKWSASVIGIVVVVGLLVLLIAFALVAFPILLVLDLLNFIFRPCPKCKRLWSRMSEGRDYTESRLALGLAVRHTYSDNYVCKRCGHRWNVIGSFVER